MKRFHIDKQATANWSTTGSMAIFNPIYAPKNEAWRDFFEDGGGLLRRWGPSSTFCARRTKKSSTFSPRRTKPSSIFGPEDRTEEERRGATSSKMAGNLFEDAVGSSIFRLRRTMLGGTFSKMGPIFHLFGPKNEAILHSLGPKNEGPLRPLLPLLLTPPRPTLARSNEEPSSDRSSSSKVGPKILVGPLFNWSAARNEKQPSSSL